jgi:hypothetical protein
MLIVLAWSLSACVALSHKIMRFDVKDYNQAQAVPVQSAAADPNPLVERLARQLEELPDLADGVDPAEADAAARLAAVAADPAALGHDGLTAVLDAPYHEFGYNAALQGLLWRLADGRFRPGDLDRMTPDQLVEDAYRALPDRYPDPEDVLRYLSWHYSYVLDFYTFKSKGRFFRDKAGDCTEFALLAGDILRRQGREVRILHSKPSHIGGHVSLIYRTDDGYWLLDASSAALARMIENVKDDRVLGPTEHEVYQKMKPYGRLFGPVDDPVQLVETYELRRQGPVPYKFITFDELDQAAETHGRELPEWWDF